MTGEAFTEIFGHHPPTVRHARKALDAITRERVDDPEPGHRDAVAHLGWAHRETICQTKARRYQATLDDYTP
jgi:hypothetical protein